MIDTATVRERAKVRALAAKLGATVVEENGPHTYDIMIEAPKGHHWKDSGLHELVGQCYCGPWTYSGEWADALGRMEPGIEPCNADCEWWGEDHDS